MCNSKKTKKVLLEELEALRRRLTKLERIEAEQKKVEGALSNKTKALDAIITNLKQGIAYLDENDTIIYLNQQCADLFGLKYEDVFQKNVYDFHPPGKRGAVEALINEFKQGKQYSNIIETIGSKVIDNTLHRIQDGDGNYRGILMSAVDITEHKKAEEALRESEARYKALFQGAAEGILVADVETMDFKYANPALCQMLGYTEEELTQMNVRDIHPKEDLEYVISEFQAKARGGKTLATDIPCVRKDGTVIYADVNTAKVSIEAREYNAGFFTDITGRKEADEALQKARDELEIRVQQRTAELDKTNKKLLKEVAERKEAEDSLAEKWIFFRTVLDNLPDHIYAKDLKSRFTLCNNALCRAVGAKHPDELLGKTDFDLFSHEQAERLFNEEQNLIKTSPPLLDYEEQLKCEKCFREVCKCKDKEGKIEWLLTTKVPLRNKDGEIIGIVGIGRYITEDKKAQQQLLAHQQQLRSLASKLSLAEERLRRRIATDVHDRISQNLAISKIKLDSLQGWSSSPEFSETLAQIRQLLEQTIESTRSLTFELSPPVLYELGLEAALNWLVRQMRKRDGLDAEFEGDGSDKLLHDDVRVFLFQAVRELLVNVVKHAEAKSVKVRSGRDGNEIVVCVEDDGKGFDLSRTLWEDYKREGFGLFSIRERLNFIGGRLDIKSSPGKGTAVTMVAPMEQMDEAGREEQR